MHDMKFSTKKVRKLLTRLQPRHMPKAMRGSIDVETPMQEKIHELKQNMPFMEHEDRVKHSEKLDSLQQVLSELTGKIASREDRIERIQSSLQDLHNVVEKIMFYTEEEKKIKLSARARHLQQVEAQLARFESQLIDAAKRYHDEELYPLKQKIADLREKYKLLKEKEEKEEAPIEVITKQEELAEELKQKIAELELPPQVEEAERAIEEEVRQISEEIESQGISLDLPDFIVPEEEELSLPSPFPELLTKTEHEEELPPPPIQQKKKSVLDAAFGEVKKLFSGA